MGRQRAARDGNQFLPGETAGNCQRRDDEEEILAISMSMPIVKLYQGVFALIRANALPLLPAPLVYAYRISEKPCVPRC